MSDVVIRATRSAFVTRPTLTEVSFKDNQTGGMTIPDITFCDKAGFWISKMNGLFISLDELYIFICSLTGA